MTRTCRRNVVFAVLLTYTCGSLTACLTWRVQPGLAGLRNDATVRLDRDDGSRVVLSGTSISGDTLYGTYFGARRSSRQAAVAIPVRDVKQVAVRKLSTGRTLLLTFGLATTVFIALGRSSSWNENYRF